MLANFGSGIKLQTRSNLFSPIVQSTRSLAKTLTPTSTLTLAMVTESVPNMVTESAPNKRLMCPSCLKPARTCLCTRFKTPILDNSIAVTILQHSLEKKHPLNSTRIVTLGLKNVNVAWVSDVEFEARFDIRLLQSNLDLGLDLSVENHKRTPCSEPSISFTIEKGGGVRSLEHVWNENPHFHELLVTPVATDDLKNGFLVKKLQRTLSKEDTEAVENDEFEIEVPRGSVLLFPSEDSVGIKEVDFKVKNLIVLDGTWAKAKRMYNENPWLKLLPHLKLDIGKLSLYGEVRHQPKAGCLSSLESIVYALKAVGENPDGLDGLLDVFESMVGDQRRCKNERLSKVGST